MRTRVLGMLVMALSLAVAGCATSEEWATWNQHPTHFASGNHMVFSVRNGEGQPPRVARTDVALASSQSWWGKSIMVAQEQILDR